MFRNSLIALSALMLGTLALGGANENSDVSTLIMGKQLVGPPTTPECLTGKVILLDFWCTH